MATYTISDNLENAVARLLMQYLPAQATLGEVQFIQGQVLTAIQDGAGRVLRKVEEEQSNEQ